MTLSRQELATADAEDDPEAASDVEAEWRGRLRRVLREDPRAADELRSLLAELSAEAGRSFDEGAGGVVENTVSGGTQYGPVIQGRDFGSLSFGAGTGPGTEGQAPGGGPPRDAEGPSAGR